MLMVSKTFSNENLYSSKLQKFSTTKKTHFTALLWIEVFGKVNMYMYIGMHCLWGITCTVHFFLYEVLNKKEITKVQINPHHSTFSSLSVPSTSSLNTFNYHSFLFSPFPVSLSLFLPSCPCPFLSLGYRVI